VVAVEDAGVAVVDAVDADAVDAADADAVDAADADAVDAADAGVAVVDAVDADGVDGVDAGVADDDVGVDVFACAAIVGAWVRGLRCSARRKGAGRGLCGSCGGTIRSCTRRSTGRPGWPATTIVNRWAGSSRRGGSCARWNASMRRRTRGFPKLAL
jgi:hypothetical protein